MTRDREAWNAYMRDYRRRKRDGIPLKGRRTVDHQACDQKIAELEHSLALVREENEAIRKLLPF